jgi:transcriptional regulator with XRE-family HTH domain
VAGRLRSQRQLRGRAVLGEQAVAEGVVDELGAGGEVELLHATLEEVGDLVGVSDEAVRLWETGQRTPSETHRDDYIDVLDDLRAG